MTDLTDLTVAAIRAGVAAGQFKAAEVDLIVVEATGAYERDLVCALQSVGLAVAHHIYVCHWGVVSFSRRARRRGAGRSRPL